MTLSEQEPPAGAVQVGAIEAVHGNGCGVFGTNGTLEGATNALREEAVRRGANFVRIVDSQEPHSTRACFDHEFRIRGIAYRTPPRRRASSESCAPPCSAGYTCRQASCQPICSPPCAANQSCRSDRTCVAR